MLCVFGDGTYKKQKSAGASGTGLQIPVTSHPFVTIVRFIYLRRPLEMTAADRERGSI